MKKPVRSELSVSIKPLPFKVSAAFSNNGEIGCADDKPIKVNN